MGIKLEMSKVTTVDLGPLARLFLADVSDLTGVMLFRGGPGTGKTNMALQLCALNLQESRVFYFAVAEEVASLRCRLASLAGHVAACENCRLEDVFSTDIPEAVDPLMVAERLATYYANNGHPRLMVLDAIQSVSVGSSEAVVRGMFAAMCKFARGRTLLVIICEGLQPWRHEVDLAHLADVAVDFSFAQVPPFGDRERVVRVTKARNIPHIQNEGVVQISSEQATVSLYPRDRAVPTRVTSPKGGQPWFGFGGLDKLWGSNAAPTVLLYGPAQLRKVALGRQMMLNHLLHRAARARGERGVFVTLEADEERTVRFMADALSRFGCTLDSNGPADLQQGGGGVVVSRAIGHLQNLATLTDALMAAGFVPGAADDVTTVLVTDLCYLRERMEPLHLHRLVELLTECARALGKMLILVDTRVHPDPEIEKYIDVVMECTYVTLSHQHRRRMMMRVSKLNRPADLSGEIYEIEADDSETRLTDSFDSFVYDAAQKELYLGAATAYLFAHHEKAGRFIRDLAQRFADMTDKLGLGGDPIKVKSFARQDKVKWLEWFEFTSRMALPRESIVFSFDEPWARRLAEYRALEGLRLPEGYVNLNISGAVQASPELTLGVPIVANDSCLVVAKSFVGVRSYEEALATLSWEFLRDLLREEGTSEVYVSDWSTSGRAVWFLHLFLDQFVEPEGPLLSDSYAIREQFDAAALWTSLQEFKALGLSFSPAEDVDGEGFVTQKVCARVGLYWYTDWQAATASSPDVADKYWVLPCPRWQPLTATKHVSFSGDWYLGVLRGSVNDKLATQLILDIVRQRMLRPPDEIGLPLRKSWYEDPGRGAKQAALHQVWGAIHANAVKRSSIRHYSALERQLGVHMAKMLVGNAEVIDKEAFKARVERMTGIIAADRPRRRLQDADYPE